MSADKNTDPQRVEAPVAAVIEGRVRLAERERSLEEVAASAYAFDGEGTLLGQADLDREGGFRIELRLAGARDVEVVVGPSGDPGSARKFAGLGQRFTADDWKRDGDRLTLFPELVIPWDVWWPWRPVRICVSGHVRKVGAGGAALPVPYVKVEVFDVDREGCWWPYITRWWDHILDQRVVRIPELIEERPIAKWPPPPDPPDPLGPRPFDLPISRFRRLPALSEALRPGEAAALNPQPLPPKLSVGGPQGVFADLAATREPIGVGPRAMATAPTPLAPDVGRVAGMVAGTPFPRSAGKPVGEVSALDPKVAERLADLTLTTLIPPWLLFPRCFYSRELICETETDCDGYFRCCFRWFPWHVRRGRLRFDSRPDVILRVTQNIGGVETVVYLDPYTSTRWNTSGTHIDLFLDNEEILAGHGCAPPPPAGVQFWVERVGSDEVYKINRHTGCFELGGLTNVAYGDTPLGGTSYAGLDFYAQFGGGLRDGAHFYRLTYARHTSPGVPPPDAAFQLIDHPHAPVALNQYRRPHGAPVGTVPDLYNLGPRTVPGPTGPVHGLYEIRSTAFDWLYSDEEYVGTWRTLLAEGDTGTYTLRVEIYDAGGNRLTSPAVEAVDNRGDGTGAPPVFGSMGDRYDLIITVDNQPVTPELAIPAAINACGVVPWSSAPSLAFTVDISQPNSRLKDWTLTCTKGTAATPIALGPTSAHASSNGSPGAMVVTIPGSPLLASEPITPANPTGQLQSTCAFALRLTSHAHVRNGHDFFRYDAPTQAIAIERCT